MTVRDCLMSWWFVCWEDTPTNWTARIPNDVRLDLRTVVLYTVD